MEEDNFFHIRNDYNIFLQETQTQDMNIKEETIIYQKGKQIMSMIFLVIIDLLMMKKIYMK